MKAPNAKLDRHQTEAMLRQTEEQRAAFLEGVTGLLASLDGMPAKPRLARELSAADREFIRGLRAIEREVHAAPHTREQRIGRLRQLAVEQKREPETIGQLIARKGWVPYAAPIEEQHGDAAE